MEARLRVAEGARVEAVRCVAPPSGDGRGEELSRTAFPDEAAVAAESTRLVELQEALSGERARAKAAEVREAAAATRLDAALRGSAQLKCLLAASLEEQRATLDASLSHPSGQRQYTAAGDPDSVGSQPSLEQRAVVDSSSPSESSPAAFHTPREF